MSDVRPWRIMYNDCCIRRYIHKGTAIKRAKIVRGSTPSNIKICVANGFEVIEIENEN